MWDYRIETIREDLHAVDSLLTGAAALENGSAGQLDVLHLVKRQLRRITERVGELAEARR